MAYEREIGIASGFVISEDQGPFLIRTTRSFGCEQLIPATETYVKAVLLNHLQHERSICSPFDARLYRHITDLVY